jgi:STE24 endopeptidase
MSSAYTLPPALLGRAHALASAEAALYFGSVAWSVVGLLAAVRLRAGETLARLASRISRKPWVQGLVVVPVTLLALAVCSLPIGAAGHAVGRHFGLSIEGWGAWLADWAESLALELALGTPLLSGLYALLRHSAQRAWLWAWVGTVPLLLLGVWAAPVVVDPLFNHFAPLGDRDPALVRRLEEVAARGGLHIPPSRILVEDASRRSTGVNAYVTGIGSSKRIVVWDTALAGIPSDELLTIYGHEQGHYVLGHIPRGIAFTSALLLALFWLCFALLRRNTRQPGAWASLPMLLLIVTVVSFLAEPVGNAFSRRQEHEADVYGQAIVQGIVAHPREAEVADFNRLGRIWLEEPDPNPFLVTWTFTHPPTGERAAWAATH